MRSALRFSSRGSEAKLYAEDVFSAYTRTGTGASATTTTNIDMTKGYMLWTKGRSGATDHAIYDSARGVTLDIASNTTAAQTTQTTGLTAVSATGHTIGALAKMNTSAATYVDWVFRKAAKFFDVVTWTGDGVATGRIIAHALGSVPAVICFKQTSGTGGPWSWAQFSGGVAYWLRLNETSASSFSLTTGGYIAPQNATSTYFEAFGNGGVNLNNASGETYVAYLFAHDTTADGLIQCGTFTTTASTSGSVTLGIEPQFLLLRRISAIDHWRINDISRNWSMGTDGIIQPNTADVEDAVTAYGNPTATGFDYQNLEASSTYIYLAIRRPNKPPTVGTQVYNAIARTGTQLADTLVTGVGFAPDLAISLPKGTAYYRYFQDRLRGAGKGIQPTAVDAEGVVTGSITSFTMDGFIVGTGQPNVAEPYINWFFKRAPGFFDEVCYTGTGASQTLSHNLSVPPELIIRKKRDAADGWEVASVITSTGYKLLYLNTTGVSSTITWPSAGMLEAQPTATSFVATAGVSTFVNYLFATLAGISKVFSYTGNGTSQTIACGFTTGARFVLIKRTDAVGDWFVWDTVRGIIAGNDPHLSLNTLAAEVTTNDSIDADASGFIVNELAATGINVNAATYIGLAIA